MKKLLLTGVMFVIGFAIGLSLVYLVEFSTTEDVVLVEEKPLTDWQKFYDHLQDGRVADC